LALLQYHLTQPVYDVLSLRPWC